MSASNACYDNDGQKGRKIPYCLNARRVSVIRGITICHVNPVFMVTLTIHMLLKRWRRVPAVNPLRELSVNGVYRAVIRNNPPQASQRKPF